MPPQIANPPTPDLQRGETAGQDHDERKDGTMKYYVQVAIVQEFCVDASDELQAERVVFAECKHRHSIVAMKVYGAADEYSGCGALTGDPIADAAEMRTFQAIDPEWCKVPAI